jgi:hypothetical protein
MNLTDVNSITNYNKLLQQLNPFGWFQKKLMAITLAFWTFAGIARTIFNKDVFCNTDDDLPFFTLSIIVGIFASAYLSFYYSRRVIMLGLSGIYSFGGLLLILSFAEGWIVRIGLYMVSFAQYSICILASCILFEYIDAKLIPIATWTMVFACHTSKFLAVIIFSQFNDSNNLSIILSSVILSFGLLQLAGSFLFQ